MAELVRLNKFISEAGICSRREADEIISSGRVLVNGKTPEMGVKIDPVKDRIKVDGRYVTATKEKEYIYLAFNKPVGVTCTTDSHERGNIVGYVNYPERVFNIGRLDKDSEGLIFLTNNGDIVNKILRAGNDHDKEYLVTVNKPVTLDFLAQMANGVPILGTRTKKCKVEKESEFSFHITLTQGLNRQIRRMCEALGYSVMKLKRVRVMHITLKGLPTGQWRFFTKEEVEEMMQMIQESSNAESASRGMGAIHDEHREYGWRAARKTQREAELLEAAKNPKSRTLRAGFKKANAPASKEGTQTGSVGKFSTPADANDKNAVRPKKATGGRSRSKAADKSGANSKSALLRGKTPKAAGKQAPRGRSAAPKGRRA